MEKERIVLGKYKKKVNRIFINNVSMEDKKQEESGDGFES